MTVDGSRVFSQQSTVNSQRLECGIIYFLEFPKPTHPAGSCGLVP
ncbi:hypothetical protein [Nostoc sphaeroides]|nr:hypothetical protein [Nostoc sphaeroides]